MTFDIPKAAAPHNSLVTLTVTPVDFNDTDVDRMLTRILEMGVKLGRTASSKVNTSEYVKYLDRLNACPELVGFEGDEGRDVLDGWVRSSILKEERKGRTRQEVQMGYLRPLTIAGYKSGLPKTNRNRRADQLAYQSMEAFLTDRGSANPSREIELLFKQTFGRGVDVGESPWHEPRYDGTTKLDIDALLTLRFLEGFEGSQNLTKVRERLDPPVPEAVVPLGRDLITMLELYGPGLPTGEAYSHISALLAIRLFQLPLITGHRLRSILDGRSADPAPSLDLYCDFVRRHGGTSDELSYRCVVRDLEVMRALFGDRLLVRSLGHALELIPGQAMPEGTAAEQLLSLAELRDELQMGMALNFQLNLIYQALDQDSDGRMFIDEVRAASQLTPSEQLRQVLVEGLRRRGLENQVKWFHSTGAISKPYGLLAGTLRARSTWRYAPSDELLTTLLMMCFVGQSGGRPPARLPIREVLDRLESRFGILIDRPPAAFDSADARAAAAENLAAFTQRLQLLGCFQGLSDDFNAQFVTRPREPVA